MSVVGGGEAGRLTPKSLAVLLRLAERPGEIVTRAELIASAWPDSHPTDDALSFAVRELRRALGDDARAPRIIETVHGVGYRIMVEGVVREDASPGPVATEPVAASDAAPLPRTSAARRGHSGRAIWAAAAAVGALVVLAGTQLYGPASIDHAADVPGLAQPPVFVTSDAGAEEYPALSPDGAFVAYSERATPGVRADIRIKSVAGPDAQAIALTDTPELSELWPSWSPDGRWIAYQAHSSSDYAIMISAASGGAPRRLARLDRMVAGRLDWSLDGRHLLASLPVEAAGRGPRLHVIDVQDGSARRLQHDLDGTGWDLDPTYSPDGQWIAFRHGVSSIFDVFVIPAAGGVARKLTHLGAVRWGLAWTADGKDVVFSTDEGGRFSILTVSLADAQVRPTGIVDASVPHVARRTARLAFQRPLLQLGMTRVDYRGSDGAASSVASSTGSVRVFATSPKGGRVAYLSNRGGPEQLWVHDAGQGADRAYDVQGRVSSLSWDDDGRGLLVVVHKGGLDQAMRIDLETGRLDALGLRRPVLRQLVDGGSSDRLYGLVEYGGHLQVARFDRDSGSWRESTRGIMAHKLVRVAGTAGVFAHTLLNRTRILRIDEDLNTTHRIEVPPPIGDWTADREAIWYTSARGGMHELRQYRLDGGDIVMWPLPSGVRPAELGIGFLGGDLLLSTVTADEADIGVVMQFR